MTKKSREEVCATLSNYYDEVGITIINSLVDLAALVAKQPDLVFLGTQFLRTSAPDRTIWLSGYLADNGITATGSSASAHEIDINKPRAKQCVLNAGLLTAPFLLAKPHQQLSTAQIPHEFPLFVKPSNRGGGMGVDSQSVVHNLQQLQAKVDAISRDLNTDSLIEQYLSGREFSVGVIKQQDSADYLALPIELVPPQDDHGSRLLSKDVKSFAPLPALEIADSALKAAVSDLAIGAFHAIGAQDYGRIDIRLDAQGTPYFLESNLIPNVMKDYGSLAKAWALNTGMTYDELLLRLTTLGLARQPV